MPLDEGLIVSPADGVISLIEHAVPPEELGMGPEALLRVSVFMNVFNVHSNRSPVDGEVLKTQYFGQSPSHYSYRGLPQWW